jgi:hypothetical protein
LHQYTAAVGDATLTYISKSLNLTEKDYVYPVEVYADRVVAEVYKSSSSRSSYAYYAMEYERKTDKSFEFDGLTEVQRVVSYKPKSSVTIAKSTDGRDVERPVFETKKGVPGWKPTVDILKDFWAPVVG